MAGQLAGDMPNESKLPDVKVINFIAVNLIRQLTISLFCLFTTNKKIRWQFLTFSFLNSDTWQVRTYVPLKHK
jgi:hypothetical protein